MRMRTLNVRRKKWKRRKNLTRIKSKSNKCNFPYKFLHPWPHLCHCVNDRNLSIIFTLQKLSKVNDWSKKVLNWVKRKLNQDLGSSSRQSIQSFGWMTQNTVTSLQIEWWNLIEEGRSNHFSNETYTFVFGYSEILEKWISFGFLLEIIWNGIKKLCQSHWMKLFYYSQTFVRIQYQIFLHKFAELFYQR